MSASRAYASGLLAVALLGVIVVALSPATLRLEITIGVLGGMLIQAPLGWWTLRSIGSEKFQLVWLGGMVIRLVIVVFAALVLAPVYSWQSGAMLLALVATLLVLLLVEAVTAVGEHSRGKK